MKKCIVLTFKLICFCIIFNMMLGGRVYPEPGDDGKGFGAESDMSSGGGISPKDFEKKKKDQEDAIKRQGDKEDLIQEINGKKVSRGTRIVVVPIRIGVKGYWGIGVSEEVDAIGPVGGDGT